MEQDNTYVDVVKDFLEMEEEVVEITDETANDTVSRLSAAIYELNLYGQVHVGIGILRPGTVWLVNTPQYDLRAIEGFTILDE